MPAEGLILRMAVNDRLLVRIAAKHPHSLTELAAPADRSSSELPGIPLPPLADSAIQGDPPGEHLALDQISAGVIDPWPGRGTIQH